MTNYQPIERPQRLGQKSVYVYGPQGCGKTHNAEALRKHFHLQTICDLGEQPYGVRKLPLTDALILGQEPLPEARRQMSFEQAMHRLATTAPGYPF